MILGRIGRDLLSDARSKASPARETRRKKRKCVKYLDMNGEKGFRDFENSYLAFHGLSPINLESVLGKYWNKKRI